MKNSTTTYLSGAATAQHPSIYYTDKKSFMKSLLQKSMLTGISLLIATLFFAGTATGQTNYYYKAAGALNAVASWSSNSNGVGGTSPANFTAANQIFNVRNISAVTNAGAWTVSGTGSKIIVGDGSAATNLTIPTGTNTITGTIDVAAAATLTITHSTIPTLGTLNAASTVVYNGTATQTISAVTYGNLSYSGSSTATFGGGCTIAGNFSCTAGNVTFNTSNADRTFNIAGSFAMSSTGTIEFGGGSGTSVVNLTGNFSKTNGAVTTSSASDNVIFNMAGTAQTMQSTSTGTLMKWIDFNIASGSTCTLSGDFTETGSAGTTGLITVSSGGTLVTGTANIVGANSTFTLSTGGNLQVGSTAGITSSGATGNIQTATRNFGAGGNYTYNGSAAQATGNGYPTSLTGILTINNSGNTVTLSAARTIASGGTINLTAGTFAAGTSLTMATTSNINRSEGSITGTLQGTGKYNVTYTGLNKTTGPELLNSGLNNLTVNETASSNTVTSATAFNASADVTVTQGNLIIQGTAADYTIAGNLVVSTNGTFTHSVNWDLTSHLLLISGSLSVDGLFTYTVRSHVQMTGAGAKTIRTGSNSSSALSILTLLLGTYSASGTLQINDNFYPMYNSTGSFSTNGQAVTAIASCLSFGGSLNVNGGSLTVTNGLLLGSASNAGTLNVSSGTLTTDGITLGDAASTLANTINQTGGTLTVNGAVNINQPAAAVTNAWNLNAATTSVSGAINFNGTTSTANFISKLLITTGTLNANGGISFTGTTAANKVIDMSGGAGTINLKGGLTSPNAATLTAGTTSIFNYADNSSAQTVNFFGAGAYNNLHINTTGGVGATLSAIVTATNTVGNLRVQSGTLDNGGFAITGNAAKTFDVVNAATFKLSGTTSAFPGGFGTVSLGATSTVNYAGSGAQTISAQNYGNLTTTLTSTRTITLAGSGTIGVAGIFTPASGTTSYTNTGSTVNFNGTSGSQNIPAFSFNNLTVSNSSGVSLTGNASVNGTTNALTFSGGRITTGSNTLTLASAVTVSGAAAGKYVYGNLAWTILTGTPTRTFDIGDATNYTPATIAFTSSITSGGTLTANTTAGDHPNISTSGLNASKSVNRYWTLTNSGISPVGFSATFNFIGPVGSGDIDAGVTTSNLIIRNYNGSSWSGTTNGTRAATSTQATGISSFGDFQVAEITCVAPVINTPVVTNVGCNGGSDGAITITTTGGTSPFTYAWSNGAITQNISGLASGNYSLVITATGGCTVSSGTINVSQPVVLSASLASTNVSCNGAGDGTITITSPTGGYGTYEYTINGGTSWQSSGSYSSLPAATYNVKIRDAAHTSCIITLNAALSVTQPTVLNATVNSANVTCYGGNDGSITITSPTGGYGTYEYTTNGGTNWQSSGSFASLSAGTYNIKIRDAAHTSCIITLNAALSITQLAVLNATVNSTNISCNGAGDGTITITSPSGGGGTYQYTINGGTSWQSSGNYTSLSPATYNVKIRDAAHTSCIVTLNSALTITQQAALSATVNSTNISCNGAGDGTITISSPTGGYGTYEYSINGGTSWQSSGSYTSLSATTYNVKIRDAAHTSCVTTLNSALTITQPATLNATLNSTNVSCNGSGDGAITISSPTGGYGAYEYTINGGTSWQSSGSYTSLSPATYNVKIRDAAHTSCIATLNGALVITQQAVLNATVNSTNVSCNGAGDGTITITSPTGGYGTYEYTINGGTSWQSSGNYTSLSPATYSVKIRDAAHTSCIATLNGALVITQQAALSATVNSTNISCNGAGDATITISSPTGGYGTYEYSINGGTSWQSSGSYTSLSAATYNVKIRDAAHTSCVATLNSALTITQPATLNATLNSTNVSCNGAGDGSITITSPTGGYGTYEYTINGGTSWQSSGTYASLSPATYNVKIRDAAHTSCIATLNGALVITQQAVLNATVNSTNVSCNGAGDGTITISSPTGGYGTYEYTINGGTSWQSSGSYTSLSPATYNVKMRDAAHTSCITTLNIALVITQQAALSATINSTNISCNGAGDGTITISSPTGGYGTYEYSINGGTSWQSSGSYTSLSAANYNVKIRDAAHTSCVATLNSALTITQPAALNATLNSTNVSCNGAGDGTITITSPTGGYGTYEYTINGGASWQSSGTYTSLSPATYNVKIRDAAHTSCIATLNGALVITQQAVLNATVNSTNVSCNGAGDGTITISSLTGGYGTYEYTINGGTSWQSSGSYTSLSPATYNVQIRDAAHTSCIATLNGALAITEQAALSATINSTNINCNGAGDGTISITSPSGGYGTYEYSIDGGTNWQSGGSFTALAAATYNVEIRDAAHTNCSATLNGALTLTEPDILNATINSTNISCNGSSDGSISLTSPTGGNGTYEYSIDGGSNWQSSGNFTSLAAANYNIQIRDAAHISCVITLNGSFGITAPAALSATVGSTDAGCAGGDGTINITSPQGGYGTYQYSINGGSSWQSGGSFVSLNAATYNVQIRDAAHTACVVTLNGSLVISQQTTLPAPTSGGDQTVCSDGDPEQTITATATGNTITWYDAATAGNIVAHPIQTGVGSVTYYAQSSSGSCTSATRTAVTLTINPSPAAPLSGGDQTVCSNGDPNQTLIATASSPVTIIWYDAATNGNVTTPAQIGIGTVTYYAEASNGTCPSPVRTPVTLSIRPVLATPGAISGPVDACPLIGNPVPTTYSITAVAGATSYTWVVPPGATIVSGQGSTSIGVSFDNSFALTNQFFRVSAESATACTSGQSSLEVFKIVPGIPAAIFGPTDACPFMGQATNAVYSVDPVPNATSYTWVVAGNATIMSGQGTTSIEVSYANNFTTGNIKVTANSNCGNRSPRSLNITKFVPAAPASITGPTDACSYIGTSTPVTYSVTAVENAVSYTWTVPAHVVLVSGQGTNSITVTFSSGYTTSLIKVKSVSNCGSSGDRTLSVVAAVTSAPGLISGPTNACVFIGTANAATYTIRKVLNANSYIWSVPAGASISSHPGGSGINDTAITVTYNSSFVGGTEISVQSVACVASKERFLAITRVGPATPGLVTGPTNPCPYMMSPTNPSGIPVTYTIAKVAVAASYTWTAPSGATISSHPAGTGVNDTTVQVIFSSGFTSGSLTVTAGSDCGSSGIRSFALAKLTPGAPGAVTTTLISNCPNRQYSYTMAAMPTNSTSIVWTVPAQGTIVSGQGTLSITVSYTSAAITGNVTATPYNNCSNSASRIVSISLPACSGFAPRMENKLISEAAPQENLQVSVSPNPTVSNFKLQVITAGKDPVTARVLDIHGTEFKNISLKPFETVYFGNELKPGIYMIEVKQGKEVKTTKLVKF